MQKTIVNPATLAKPSGYAHGVLVEGGRVLFLAGQTALDGRGKIVAPGDMVGQFRQALANLQSVVAQAGGSMTDLVKLTLFVTDKRAYQAEREAIGEAYRECLGTYYPAMTLVEVKSLWDETALIEIEGIAVLDEARGGHGIG